MGRGRILVFNLPWKGQLVLEEFRFDTLPKIFAHEVKTKLVIRVFNSRSVPL